MSVKRGFSLVELMVALAAASILSLSVFTCFSHYHHGIYSMVVLCRRDQERFVKELRCINPYISCHIK